MTGNSSSRPRRLLLSIHDVSPRHEAEVDRLMDRLADAGGSRLAMLVVPDFWGEAPIVPGSPFAARLRGWADQGIEIFLHGFWHRDTGEHDDWAARFKAKTMTAGEGEFLGLDQHSAATRIRDGRALLEGVLGRPIAGFVAPAWLYGEGTHAAMSETGIALAESHWKVWSPLSGEIYLKSPVITWATRTRLRMLSSLGVAALARTLPLPRAIRVGVHPGDLRIPATLSSISRTVAHIARTHRPSHYRELVEDHGRGA